MNRIEISAEEGTPVPFARRCRRYVERVLRHRGIRNWEVSILFCSNDMIQTLNRDYREKDLPTDVLTFCQLEGDGVSVQGRSVPAGDIVISIEYIHAHAAEYGVTEDDELKRLLIHGILHLEGMDHRTNDHTEAMLVLQEDILQCVKGVKIL
ncbi:MAG: rRNA maturation RNase YbeY [Spirochaetales bacterium]|nr:rRNA maturation RNase YbeY [Spirochaetales bacterium]